MSIIVFLIFAITLFFVCSLTVVAWNAIATEADNFQWSVVFDSVDVEDGTDQLATVSADYRSQP